MGRSHQNQCLISISRPVPSSKAFCKASSSINLSSISYQYHHHFFLKHIVDRAYKCNEKFQQQTSVFETENRSWPNSNFRWAKNSSFNLQINSFQSLDEYYETKKQLHQNTITVAIETSTKSRTSSPVCKRKQPSISYA